MRCGNSECPLRPEDHRGMEKDKEEKEGKILWKKLILEKFCS